MSEAAAHCIEIFSLNSLENNCRAVLTSVKYLAGLRKIDSIISNIRLT